MTETTIRLRAACPACKRETELGLEAEPGSLFACPHCGIDLEVIALDPPRFGLAYDWPEVIGRGQPWRHRR